MSRRATCLCCLLLGTPVVLHAQNKAPPLQASSCPAADSALGPQTSAQRKSHLLGWYSAARDQSFAVIDNPLISSSGMSAVATWPGHGPASTPSVELMVFVPSRLLENPIGAEEELQVLVDDSLDLTLGTPATPKIVGINLPPYLPMLVTMPPASFLAMAHASSAVTSFRGTRVVAQKKELAALNALHRVLSCGVIAPATPDN